MKVMIKKNIFLINYSYILAFYTVHLRNLVVNIAYKT